jgi:hypothetical protein
MALCVGPPAAAFWHCRQQHLRTATGSLAILAMTAPQLHRPL